MGWPLVCSSRISYRGPDRLDVTRKSGGPDGLPFAPSMTILGPALRARREADAMRAEGAIVQAAARESEAWEIYKPAFVQEMRRSWKHQRPAWDRLLSRERVVLVCYCTNPTQCHRMLLRVAVFPSLGAVDGGEIS